MGERVSRVNRIVIAFCGVLVLSGCSIARDMSEQSEQKCEGQITAEGTSAPSASAFSKEDTDPVMQETEGTIAESVPEQTQESIGGDEQKEYCATDELKGLYAADGQYVYWVTDNRVYRLDRKNSSMEVLAELPETDGEATYFEVVRNFYREGEYLYYRSGLSDDGSADALWRIHTRSGVAERLAVPAPVQNYSSFFIAGHRFYFQYWANADGKWSEQYAVYEITEDGGIGKELTDTPENQYSLMPAGCKDAYAGMLYGSIPLPYQLEHYDRCVLVNAEAGEYLLYDPETGGQETLFSTGKDLLFYDGENLLYAEYDYSSGEEERRVCAYRVSTGECMETDAENICAADRKGLYYFKTVEDERTDVRKLELYRLGFGDISDGGCGELLYSFEENLQAKDGLGITQRSILALEDGELYFADCSTGQPEMMQYGTGHETARLTDCGALEINDVRAVGDYIRTAENCYCERCKQIELEYDIESFVIHESEPGDGKINAALEECLKNQIQKALTDYTGEACDRHEGSPEGEACNRSQITLEVSYVSGDYIGFLWRDYEYSRGMAHGIPSNSFKLYDRKTGKELRQEDILATPQEELDERISDKFGDEYSLKCGVGSYYLTQKGLVYYYPVYEAGSFAVGMPSVLIPYGELEWKIGLW